MMESDHRLRGERGSLDAQGGPLSPVSLRQRPLDVLLVFWFCVFSVSSFIYEQFVVFGVDLAAISDVFGRS